MRFRICESVRCQSGGVNFKLVGLIVCGSNVAAVAVIYRLAGWRFCGDRICHWQWAGCSGRAARGISEDELWSLESGRV